MFHENWTANAAYRGTPHVPDRRDLHSRGLPKSVSVEEYKRDPVFALSLFNYKINAQIRLTRDSQKPVLTVLETGAGLKVIRAKMLPPEAVDVVDSVGSTRCSAADGQAWHPRHPPAPTSSIVKSRVSRFGSRCACSGTTSLRPLSED